MRVSETYNEDCMVGMKRYPDKFFNLAIVDPPYGIGDFQQSDGNFKPVKWNDLTPQSEYFSELSRVSSNQIIWGANYYNAFTNTGGAIVWDKKNMHPQMSRYEIAAVSTHKRIASFTYEWHGYVTQRTTGGTIHPCEKPVALYKWLLTHYAKTGDKILDTHLGSQSSRIAAYDLGFDFYGWELDKDYFEAGNKRFNQFKAQGKLFNNAA